jgi:hypothetical protein
VILVGLQDCWFLRRIHKGSKKKLVNKQNCCAGGGGLIIPECTHNITNKKFTIELQAYNVHHVTAPPHHHITALVKRIK